jgi:Carboxypeptidase regulatory-like domain
MRCHSGWLAFFARAWWPHDTWRLAQVACFVSLGTLPDSAFSTARETLTEAPFAVVQDTSLVRVRVTDTTLRVIEGAEIFVVQLGSTVRTGIDGVAVFPRSASGHYDLGIRKLGFLPASMRIDLTAATPMHTIVLRAIGVRLPPVVTTATQQGLTVIVSDTLLRPLKGARVSARGSGRSARTDAQGRAQIDLSAGSYLVQVQRDSFAQTLIAVNIPKNAGREIAVWMSELRPDQRAQQTMEATRLFDLDRRMLRASPSMSRFYTREQLEELGITDMAHLAAQWASGLISGLCSVTMLEGAGTYQLPLASVYTSEVEFVELYMPSIALKTTPRGNTSLGGNRTRYMTAGSGVHAARKECGNVGLHVWSRR